MPELPDSEPLLTLLTLAEAGSESAAAEVLGIGQSSVSRRLATLQRSSGEPLTQRTATGSKLTAAGERLLPYARELRASLTAAARLLAADAAGPLALRFGLTSELAPRFAGPLVSATSGLHEPRFVEADEDELLAGVRAGRLHAALTTWAPAGREPGFTTERIAGDRIDCIAAPGGSLFMGGHIDPTAYRERTLLLPPAASSVGVRARGAVRAAGLEPRTAVTLGSQAAVLAAALAGAGMGVVLASACRAEVAAGWLASAPVPGDESRLDVWLIVSDTLGERDASEIRAAVATAVVAAATPEDGNARRLAETSGGEA